MELWSCVGLEALGNIIGRIVLIDEKYVGVVDKKVVILLVEVDILKGLVP